jgi:uncharacterized oligopeptide transporter (OPT) family protein
MLRPAGDPRRWRFLPRTDTPAYHLLLAAISLFVLGPLCGVATTYMAFSLGFTVASQVLAGILGSTITYGYGPDGKHGANYMQTMAASVASMASMAVLIQAMVWLDMDLPPAWALILYFTCIGMFGIGLGMMYTPLLVDRLQLEYPSGHAVANILRALTDARLLRRSVGKLGGGTLAGLAASPVVDHLKMLSDREVSASAIGAGMIVSSRISVPTIVMAVVGLLLSPYLRAIGWIGEGDPFRKVGFLIALAMIMGAALVDLCVLGYRAIERVRARREAAAPARDGGLSSRRLLVWVLFWGAALVVVASVFLHQPVWFVIVALALCFVFVLVNGISMGITDSNPISSAFVISVLVMSGLGLRDPRVGMLAASVLLVSCTVGVDMQQDRSTGWRLGSDRAMQFRYQAVGIGVGAVLCVLLAQFFMQAYPVLRIDKFAHPHAAGGWQSAMTFKFVGAIRDIGHLPAFKLHALEIGFAIGFGIQVARKLLLQSPRYKDFVASGKAGFAVGWVVDAVLLASPYALSFGGFIEFWGSVWFGIGGVITSLVALLPAAEHPPAGEGEEELPADMSTTSLVGGGLIAGESLFTVGAGIASLLARWLH